MGRRKFRLSALPKNFERNSKGQRQVGRPRKKMHSATISIGELSTTSAIPTVSIGGDVSQLDPSPELSLNSFQLQ